MVYVCRDPKDILVSWWHLREKMRPETMEPVPFAKAFELFCEGRCNYGPVREHVLELWRESVRRPEKVLFMKYEEMLEEPAVGSAKRLAEFRGCPFSPEEEKEGVVEGIVSPEMAQRMDEITKEKLKGSGLILGKAIDLGGCQHRRFPG